MEAAADDVVHAAERHRVERLRRHLALRRRSRNSSADAGGNFGAAEPAPLRVELLAQRAHGVVEHAPT